MRAWAECSLATEEGWDDLRPDGKVEEALATITGMASLDALPSSRRASEPSARRPGSRQAVLRTERVARTFPVIHGIGEAVS